jgi:hypothetical protein
MKLLIQLNGGLGNQMFQYVFGKKLEKKYKCEIFFQHNNHGNRKYMLDIFGITEKKFPPNLITNKIVYKGSYNNDNVLNYNNLNENENYYIDGYFQHTDYFSEIIDDVYNMFKLESPIKIDDEYFDVLDHKGLPLNTPIFTTKGWKTMGTLTLEDKVFDSDGCQTEINVISDIKNKDCYQITFGLPNEVIYK